MKIAIYTPSKSPISIGSYTKNVINELNLMGVETVSFSDDSHIPANVDLYWDPNAAGGNPPARALSISDRPYVVTLHGAAPFSLPAREFSSSYKSAILTKIHNLSNYRKWASLKKRPNAIITVSKYAKKEICHHLPLEEDTVFPIYHGVDHDIFNTSDKNVKGRQYLLHISQYQPKKNLKRIVEAYRSLKTTGKPDLIAIVPGYNETTKIAGLEISNMSLSHKKLVKYYQGAIGFVFPSLQESFGMPILEAMASGCPVTTSNTTACPEVAGDAALLVNPRSIDEISEAMNRLATDTDLRYTLYNKGIERASQFTWKKCATEHLKVFEKVLSHA